MYWIILTYESGRPIYSIISPCRATRPIALRCKVIGNFPRIADQYLAVDGRVTHRVSTAFCTMAKSGRGTLWSPAGTHAVSATQLLRGGLLGYTEMCTSLRLLMRLDRGAWNRPVILPRDEYLSYVTLHNNMTVRRRRQNPRGGQPPSKIHQRVIRGASRHGQRK